MRERDAKAPVSPEVTPNGLTRDEDRVMTLLMRTYRAFLSLDREHPDEMREFVDGVHRIQGVLAMRVVRRAYPQGWQTYEEVV
jgi:hypothetical protein